MLSVYVSVHGPLMYAECTWGAGRKRWN